LESRLLIMLEMQDAMNTRVHPQWRRQNFEWYRAIWVECAELLDHYGWKWWKRQEPDLDQVKLELVDIWHFGMSDLLGGESDYPTVAGGLAPAFERFTAPGDFPGHLEAFAADTLRYRRFDPFRFVPLLTDVALPFDELYQRYIGKNVLNFFRQDHGYRDGSYRKTWAGREDNEHLVELVDELDSTQPDFKDLLYAGLAERYRRLKP